jgi:single-strand DNA-binding protein
MASLNKVFLVGNLTRDPEMRFTPGGAAVTEFGMAINRFWKSQDGEQKKDTCFLDVTVWGKQAEMCAEHLKKGRQIFLEGRLVYDEWKGKDGQKRNKIKIVAERVQFMDRFQQKGDGAPATETAGAMPEAEMPDVSSEPAPAEARADDEPPF